MSSSSIAEVEARSRARRPKDSPVSVSMSSGTLTPELLLERRDRLVDALTRRLLDHRSELLDQRAQPAVGEAEAVGHGGAVGQGVDQVAAAVGVEGVGDGRVELAHRPLHLEVAVVEAQHHGAAREVLEHLLHLERHLVVVRRSSSCSALRRARSGRSLGSKLGASVGKSLGKSDGSSVGKSEGSSVGMLDGLGRHLGSGSCRGTWFGSSDGRGDSVSSGSIRTSTPSDSSSAGW